MRSAPELIIANSTPVLAALLQETRAIPLVFVQVIDPVTRGFVATLARPGGNITGFTNFEFPMGSKWVEILKEIVPVITHVATVYNPKTAGTRRRSASGASGHATPRKAVRVWTHCGLREHS